MTATDPLIEDCVDVLVEAFPVEDIWLLEASDAKECELDDPLNLVIMVPDEEESHLIEHKAVELMQKTFPDFKVGIYVFPLSVLFRTPRPLMVKMALTSGKSIYCG